MINDPDQSRLLLAIVRGRWDDAQRYGSSAQAQPKPFLELCIRCDIAAWIHERLERQDAWSVVGEAVRERLSAHRRRLRNDNLLLLGAAEQCLDILEGLDVVALKGLDLLQRFYPSFDARALDDVDLLIPHAQLRESLDRLERAGWLIPPEPQKTHYIRSSHHLPYSSPKPFPTFFEMHWNLAQENRYSIDAAGLIERAVPTELEGRPLKRLDDHDLAAHLLIHHLSHYFDVRLKWLVDLEFLTQSPDFAWERVIDRVREWNGTAAAAISLVHLHKLWPELVPQSVLDLLPAAAWRRLLAAPLLSSHPLELYRGTRKRNVQLYLAAVFLERPWSLPSWLWHRKTRDHRMSENPLDPSRTTSESSGEPRS